MEKRRLKYRDAVDGQELCRMLWGVKEGWEMQKGNNIDKAKAV